MRHHSADGLDELYDVAGDPDERRNLYNDEKTAPLARRFNAASPMAAEHRRSHPPGRAADEVITARPCGALTPR